MQVSRLTLVDGTFVDVPNGSLVFDGYHYVLPSIAKYVLLLTDPSKGKVDTIANINVKASYRLAVSSIDPVYSVATPSSSGALIVTDPSNGQPVFGITYNGALMAYVNVQVA